MNIAYRAIPIALCNLAGSIEQAIPPVAVPRAHPKNGVIISPNMYEKEILFFSKEAIAKISSVIPKAIICLLNKDISEVIFWDKDKDINIYRMFIIKVVNAISNKGALAIIKEVPANCPADVKLDKEIKTVSNTGSPPLTAINPKVKETGKYPKAIGIPDLKPRKKSLK